MQHGDRSPGEALTPGPHLPHRQVHSKALGLPCLPGLCGSHAHRHALRTVHSGPPPSTHWPCAPPFMVSSLLWGSEGSEDVLTEHAHPDFQHHWARLYSSFPCDSPRGSIRSGPQVTVPLDWTSEALPVASQPEVWGHSTPVPLPAPSPVGGST